MKSSNFICPVCGYNRLQEKTRDNNVPSFEICSCCGTEFGYDDCNQESIMKRRIKWIESGYKWFSEEDKPDNWNAIEQLKNIEKI